MRRIVADKERVGRFVMDRMPIHVEWDKYAAIGLERNDVLVAGVLYESMTKYDCNMHCAIDDPRVLNFEYLFTVFHYPFVQCGLRRVTGLVPESNQKALAFDINKVGFRVEGLVRKALANDENVYVLGMLKEECKWLQGRQKGKR
jgi:hypothetical protein